ncbi:PREDICTED: protein DMR6-LIKE OXYGENASE 2 [Nelumbo nucifera]|uniref:Protein DMR6-LIKE OXYGENASE 2 n=1 Tax=Nelumbo nucifera TaxID=4432 RepID=A0A1U8AFV8_NELNU|nr:PREDICTED: protein DMR6-LIKE OXYGENASE 2 [Nelumbo nucifera]
MEVVAGKPLRVQSLAQAGLANVPSQFIQPPETRPGSWGETPDSRIPVIDLFLFDPQHSDDVRRNLRQYCSEWGAFQVRNHGVPQRLLDDMRRTGLSFFNDCPMSERSKYFCDPNSAASEGYGSRMLVKDDSVLDWRDYFDHHSLPLSRRNPTRWPDFPPNYREVVTEYSDQMNSLAQKLLGLMSKSLGLSSSCIEKAIEEVYQNITISYYPPCPQPELTLGLQAHSDIGAITLLIQDDVGGLQVLKDGKWINVQPLSDAIVVILADQTEIITNGKYRSAEHRAITNANRARLSVATFHEPAKTRKISPAAELLNNNSSLPRYREVVYGEYVSSWYTKGPEGKRNVDALLLVH